MNITKRFSDVLSVETPLDAIAIAGPPSTEVADKQDTSQTKDEFLADLDRASERVED